MADKDAVIRAQKTASKDGGKIAASAGMESNIERVNREFQEKSALKAAKDLGLSYINIGKTPLNPDVLKLVDFEMAKEGRIIAFFRVGKKLRAAVESPNNPKTKTAIKDLTERGFEVGLTLASAAGIDEALKTYQDIKTYEKPKIIETVEEKAMNTYEKEIKILSDLPEKLDLVTAEEALNLLNIGAMKTAASDIHYEPQEKGVAVRLRIDGVLHKVFELDAAMFAKISGQIKYEAGMRLNVNSIPQDGRYVFNYNEKKIAVRVSSIPTPYGEAFVCRFLVGGNSIMSLQELGFTGKSLAILEQAGNINNGMILCCGPTGSGKTTTLYSILNKMNTPENKIITLEDPVEFYIKGVTQSQIDEKHGYNFGEGLKAVLRQDPDIVMLGEIRDLQTAETAARAALTGHILLSTLHTNSAVETIPRLVNIGLPAFMIAPAINTIIAQRLVRRVCKCAKLRDISPSEKAEMEKIADVKIPQQLLKAGNCKDCSSTGYKGRTVIAETLILSVAMKDLILKNAPLADLSAQAKKEGMVTMQEDGIAKVIAGVTTLEEVHRVISVQGSQA
ncbi:type II/IV secretion system protein [Candidatus Peregrinibacteria bacterium]|nr:type II/IV secretion system protein [Candidatus Peregrinibacteria bacterium]